MTTGGLSKVNRILIGVLVVQVALVLVFALRSDETSIGKLEPILADFDGAKIERIQVFDRVGPAGDEETEPENAPAKGEKPGTRPAVELVKKGDGWVLASHFDYPADPTKVTELLDNLEGMRSRGPIASGTARQKQLRVADGAYQRKLVLTAGGKALTILVGESAGGRQTSVRIAGADAVHGVSGLSAYNIGTAPSGWVTGPYLDLESKDIASVDLTASGGAFHFERAADGTAWTATVDGQPVVIPADSELDQDHINKIIGQLTKVYMKAPGDPKRSIAKPLATATIRLKAAAPEPPEPPPGGEAPEAVSTPDESGAEHVIEIAEADKKDQTYVRERNRPEAILVDALSITDAVELTRQRLVHKKDEKKAEIGAPGEGPMDGLPPGIDPSMLGAP